MIILLNLTLSHFKTLKPAMLVKIIKILKFVLQYKNCLKCSVFKPRRQGRSVCIKKKLFRASTGLVLKAKLTVVPTIYLPPHINLHHSSHCRPWWSRGNVLASRSKIRGSKPDFGRWIFSGRKNSEHKSSGRNFKLGVPSLRFQTRSKTSSLKRGL